MPPKNQTSPSFIARARPVTTATPYVSGDQIGALMEFVLPLNFKGGFLVNVMVADRGKYNTEMELWLFPATLTVAGDNAVAAIDNAYLDTCMGVIEIASTEYKDLSANSLATIDVSPRIIELSNDLYKVYGFLVAREGKTFGVDSLQVGLGIQED